jgi:DNA repair exonuclease SbcCD ATPase subunit
MNASRNPWRRLLAVGCLTVLTFTGCSSMYYNAMEKVGYHKRDLLVSRVQGARDAQQEAKEQFESALEQFQSVLGTTGGSLEQSYKTLNREYKRSESKAKAVHERIAAVENVATALFKEWQAELDQYANLTLRRRSESQLQQTQRQYQQLLGAMKRAEGKIDPVLTAFHDQVLFLKHNLNAQAIAALQSELQTIETDVARLISEMEASIREAESFLRTVGQG